MSNFERGAGVGELIFKSYDDIKGFAGKILSGAKMFIFFTFIAFITSIAIIAFGSNQNSKEIVFIGVIMEAISAFILAMLAAAIGAIFGSKGLFRFVQMFFIYRLIIALFVLIAPDFADFSNVGIALFASCILGLLAMGARENTFAKALVWLVMIGTVVGMYLPNFSDTTNTGLSKLNDALATSDLANVNRSEIDNKTFEFYNSKGRSKYWYCVTPDRKIELYTKGGYEKTYRIKRSPVDGEVSNYILSNGSGIISSRNFGSSGSPQAHNPPPVEQKPAYSPPPPIEQKEAAPAPPPQPEYQRTESQRQPVVQQTEREPAYSPPQQNYQQRPASQDKPSRDTIKNAWKKSRENVVYHDK